jgi:glycosyltransferase involved in cell wall biosynthesis
MPNYNASKYIKYAIDSILNQTYTNIELIIVDDCSTDDSWNIIKSYAAKDKRIKHYRNTTNMKIAINRNIGLSKISKESRYVAMLDSDDISMSNRISKQVEFLESNICYGIVGSNIVIIDEYNNKIKTREYSDKDQGIIYIKNPLAQSTVMFSTDILKKVKGYNDKYEVAEDYDLWFRILDGTKKFKILQDNLIQYRISTTQTKNTKLKKTILNSIKIKLIYIKKNKMYKVKYFIRLILEMGLLFLPNKTILWLFSKIEYK